MVLWQFAVITVLIGALLVYVIVLTNRLTFANATLRRIEEALAKAQPVAERVSAAEATVAEAIQAPEVPLTERRGRYMTVRDLKVVARAGRRGGNEDVVESLVSSNALNASRKQDISRPPPAVSAETAAVTAESLQSHQALDPSRELQTSPAGVVVSEEFLSSGEFLSAASPETHEAVNTSSEPQGLPSSAAVVQELAAATSEIREFLESNGSLETSDAPDGSAAKDVVAVSSEVLETDLKSQSMAQNSAVNEVASPESHAAMNRSDEPQIVPAARDLDAEVIERRKRDALLIMSAQRRRRRARGY
jgi:hypothetical protein